MILMMIAALAASKAPVVVSSLTTEQLVSDCRGKDTDPAATFCTGYIIGAFDTLSQARQICPKPASASTLDTVASVRRYLRMHDEQWTDAPSFVVRNALRAKFSCGSTPVKRKRK
ncbi:hypothetical protein C8J44_0206 [Sphingomonas sp. PP-CE-3A-406]|uniref:Rap1a/Tai family immunity protein n=1 Tax=Sphingomonas sp. PP-CE-3A-406 TaxID=2135659 RepID=UPI000F13C5D3|nr:Rap1a/Tai family immunity protein [Sphingomonas sp. PP-CE-3A-406]RMB54974.1 hypothetical protein C8J44_0206 [Sphingomonas sp. PP-CE-3A-406]